MDLEFVKRIVSEELERAESGIIERLFKTLPGDVQANPPEELPPLPSNPKYKQSLDLYRSGASHSRVSKELGTPMNNTKRYYNWLVKNGHLTAPEEPLSEREGEVVDCIFKQGMSLSKTAGHLGISIANVSQRRDSALRKGYRPSR
jgi:DNA-binding CsgD family transcriptional regulator